MYVNPPPPSKNLVREKVTGFLGF